MTLGCGIPSSWFGDPTCSPCRVNYTDPFMNRPVHRIPAIAGGLNPPLVGPGIQGPPVQLYNYCYLYYKYICPTKCPCPC